MLLFLWLICFATPLYPRFNNFSSYFLYSFLIHSSGYLSEAMEQAYQAGIKPITFEIIQSVLAPDLEAMEAKLAGYGYNL